VSDHTQFAPKLSRPETAYSPLRELQILRVTICLRVKVTSHILTHTSPKRVTENDQGSAKITILAYCRPIKLNLSKKQKWAQNTAVTIIRWLHRDAPLLQCARRNGRSSEWRATEQEYVRDKGSTEYKPVSAWWLVYVPPGSVFQTVSFVDAVCLCVHVTLGTNCGYFRTQHSPSVLMEEHSSLYSTYWIFIHSLTQRHFTPQGPIPNTAEVTHFNVT